MFRVSKRKRPCLPKVLLLIETSTGYGRGILEGIGRYVREYGPWLIFFERRGLADPPPRWLHKWQGHGIIARTATRSVAKRLRATGLPVVDLLGDRQEGPAKIHTDNAAAGRLAAEHLLDCGLRHFGFFGSVESWAVPLQREGFCSALAKRGCQWSLYEASQRVRSVPVWQEAHRPAVAAWLRKLPKPVGIFTCDPEHALCLLDVCRAQNIAVPEQAAIIANGDDPVLYNVTTPPLSGVDTNPTGVGYEAAALLDRMMAGHRPSKEITLVPPAHVVARQSTDIICIADPEVAEAVRYIRERACRGIDVSDVAEVISLARRTLERRFRQHLGRTPKEEIVRVRLAHAKTLLQGDDMSIEHIARRSGFASFRNFARIFNRETGTTPRQFRRAQKT
jgi:LacI family transcriptional regulator